MFGLAAVNSTNPKVQLLSAAMVDYWLSFVVSQTPNDGKGLPSACLVDGIITSSHLFNIFRDCVASIYLNGTGASYAVLR